VSSDRGLPALLLTALIFLAGSLPVSAIAQQPDSQEMYAQFLARADKGEAFAQEVVGVCYLVGCKATPRDHVAARFWLAKAAEQGRPQAQRLLGMMHEAGFGGAKDYTEALSWYRKAAGQGNAVAQASLGKMYAEGRGVPQDPVRAHMWLSTAMSVTADDRALPEKARQEMTSALASLAQGMSQQQLEQARSLAEACIGARYQRCD
jgi:hypothetical protein